MVVKYKADIPVNHKEICTDYDIVSGDIEARKIARPSQIAKILGEDGVKPFYFMDALMHYEEYRGKNYVVKYARRDRRPPQLHALDSALKPFYRLSDTESPVGHSGYFHTPREVYALIDHDNDEVFGRSLIGALIVNFVESQLLGKDLGKNVNLLTNKSELVLKPLEDYIKKLPIIDHENVYAFLGRQVSNFEERTADEGVMVKLIRREYQRVLTALTSFRAYVNWVKQEGKYEIDQEGIVGIINEISNPVSVKVKNREFLEPGYVKKYVINIYERSMKIMKWANETGNYDEVDEVFLSTIEEHKTKFLSTLKKTLYRHMFIKDMVESVKHDVIFVFQNRTANDDSYLAPVIEKNGDCIDSVSKMDHISLANDTSIFRKARRVLAEDIELGEFLIDLSKNSQRPINFQRLYKSADYLLRNLNTSVDNYLLFLQEESRSETHYNPWLRAFEHMQQKMGGFKEKVAEISSIDDLVESRTPIQLPLFR